MSGQLLINVPIVLKETVLLKVTNKQESIFLKLLEIVKQKEDIVSYRQTIDFIESWHMANKKHAFMFSNGCGCEYCVKTREYANLKLSIYRTRGKLDDCYSLYPSERYKSECEFLHNQEIRLDEMINERKILRNCLGFISKKVLREI